MPSDIETLIAEIWTGVAHQVSTVEQIEPHAMVGVAASLEDQGVGLVRLGSIPKELYNTVLDSTVKQTGADFVVIIHEAFLRVSKTKEPPMKFVGKWPNIEKVIDTDGMEAIDSVVVTYAMKGGTVTLETKKILRREDGTRYIDDSSHVKTSAVENRFLDGIFPPDKANLH